MRSRATFDDTRGFALVEALASLVILALMSLMLIDGVSAGRRVWERTDQVSRSWEDIEAAQSLLRDRIEQIFPQTLFDENPPYVDFQGSSTGMVFLANPPWSERPAPLRRYTLRLNSAGELVLASMSDVGRPETAPVTRQVLLRRVQEVDLAYFGAAAPDHVRRWRTRWVDQPGPPELVRIRLAFEPGDQRHWPEMIARPRATIDASCLLNTLNHHCKGRA